METNEVGIKIESSAAYGSFQPSSGNEIFKPVQPTSYENALIDRFTNVIDKEIDFTLNTYKV